VDDNAMNQHTLIIGLGNPGIEYHNTRHNVGFIAIDCLARHYHLSLNIHKKFNAEIGSCVIRCANPRNHHPELDSGSRHQVRKILNKLADDIHFNIIHLNSEHTVGVEKKVIFAKPITYMNLSGPSVLAIASYYKINIDNIFIIHDDVDLALGRIKIKQGGSSAGHNGLKSIDKSLGPNYRRIRIGVGKPTHGELANYVLGRFTNEEYTEVTNSINKIIDNFPTFLETKKI
jgi:peptidyl-tRNA hydrolase, PTH1 family